MKKFLNKTKKSITVGIGKIDEKVGSDKKREESPEFTQAIANLNEFEEAIKGFKKSINSLRDAALAFGEVIINAGNSFNNALKDGDEGKQVAQNAKNLSEQLKVYYNNAHNYFIPTFVTSKLNDINNQIKQIKLLIDKRKKNQILLKQEESNLKSAREKNQNVEKHEESTKARKKKFKKYNKLVLEEVEKVYSSRFSTYQELYSSIIFYQSELMNLTLQGINSNVPQLSFESNRDKYQSVTSAVPETSETK
ncbi:hypothetical protein GPJ56_008022 [Histomonas meleagridis]|uniref:uncharacterized protein n=1 Tax=Histomonas meleagridis TaxID=135588 RepID=UPI00355A97FF|nr:hypothetical protein GPJ56_008022 [Histomonas meleagridis]KAH0804894.1 hypothetical protein GO595_002287 [Histomonas meleagridis]